MIAQLLIQIVMFLLLNSPLASIMIQLSESIKQISEYVFSEDLLRLGSLDFNSCNVDSKPELKQQSAGIEMAADPHLTSHCN